MKKSFIILTLLLLSILLNAQYQVGHKSITFVDASRSNRSIAADVYYPANAPGDNVAIANGPFPLIVFGHGFIMADPDLYTYLWESLASEGYIFVFPTTEGSMFPFPNHLNFGLDLKFLNVQIKNENNVSTSFFYGNVAENSAIMGHSMGGKGVYIAAANNSDITTAISLGAAMSDPPLSTSTNALGVYAPEVIVPTLVIDSEFDCVVPDDEGHKLIYDTLTTPCKTYINIKGGGHCFFASSDASNCESGEGSCSGSFTISRVEQNETVLEIILPYLDSYLKGNIQGETDFLEYVDSLILSDNVTTWAYRDCSSNDLSVTAITSPTTNCLLSDDENVTIAIENLGSADASGFTVSYTVNSGQVITENYVGTIPAYQTVNFTFNTTSDLSVGGTYHINAYVTLTSDEDNSNDALSVDIENLNTVANLPILVDFTNFNTTGDNLNALFSDWYEARGTTPAGTTSRWIGKQTIGALNNYTAKINFYSNPVDDWIVGPAFVATDLSSLKFKAAVTTYNTATVYANGMATSDFVKVMLSSDCGTTWNSIFTINSATGLTNSLEEFEIPLSSYEGTSIAIAFFAQRSVSNGYDYDFHLDDINIFNRMPNDIGVSEISTTAGSCNFTDDEHIVVEITNYGNIPQSNFQVAYELNNGTQVTETVTDIIQGNSILNYTFTESVNMTQVGVYNVVAYTLLTNDQVNSNDSINNYSVENTNKEIPINVDFTGYDGDNLETLFDGWYEMDGFTPNYGTSEWAYQTGLNGTGNITAKINIYDSGTYSWLVSPFFRVADYSRLSFDAAITAWDNTNAYANGMGSDDELNVMISSDCGATWQVLYTFNDTTTLTNTFRNHILNLSNYSGQTVAIAFYATDGSYNDSNDYDFHIDNINLYNDFPIELEAMSFVTPVLGNTCYSNNETITVRVKNNGADTLFASQNNIAINLNITGVNPQSLSLSVDTGFIAPNQTVDYILLNSYNMLMSGNFIFNGSVLVQGDGNLNNNDFNSLIINIETPSLEIIGEQVICSGSSTDLVAVYTEGNNFSEYENNNIYSIPDNNTTGVVSQIQVLQNVNAANIYSVELNINHTYDGDLTLELFAPDGSSVILSAENGGSGDNFVATIFSDNATNAITSGSAPFTGEYLPEESFQNLTGLANGTWSLKAVDGGAQDVGTIQSWKIIFENINILTYNWSNGDTNDSITVSPNTTETYTVEVTNSCGLISSQSAEIEVIQSGYNIDLGIDTRVCIGDSIVLEAGTGFDTYLWNDNSTEQNLVVYNSGTYSITATNICGESSIDTIEIDEFQLPIISLGADRNICDGENTILDAGVYTSYNWNNGFATTQSINVDTQGEYILEITDINNCRNSDTIIVNVFDAPIINLSNELGFCVGGSVIIDAGNGFANYEWSNDSTNQSITVDVAGIYIVTVTNNENCQNSDTVNVVEYPNPSINLGNDISICIGDIANINAPAGFDGYEWNTNETSQSIQTDIEGEYIVVVTDEFGCQNSDSVLLTVNDLPLVDLGQDIVICSGEVTTLDAGVYNSYDWNNGFSNNQSINVYDSGDYVLQVTDINNCSNFDTINVNVLDAPIITLSNELGFCLGGSVIIDAGNGYTSYEWNNDSTNQSITVDVAGTYIVTVTNDENCQNSDTVIVVEYPDPSINLGNDISICDGNVANINAPAGFDSYHWNTNETSQSIQTDIQGEYIVVVTDEFGCVNSDTIIVTVNSLPSIYLGPDTEVCAGSSITLDAGVFSSYDWSTGETTQTVFLDSTGIGFGSINVSVNILDIHGCAASDDINITFENCLNVSLLDENKIIDIYPNPNKGVFTIESESIINSLIITDLTGKSIFSTDVSSYNRTFDLSNMPQGLYFVHIKTSNGSITKKIVIK